MHDNLKELLAAGADDAIAISAPGRAALTHGGLRRHIDETIGTLNRFGIGRNDRVAIVLNNGPEMASCFVACASGVTSAPLNPAYRADEFEFYLSDLHAKALIVEQASHSPAIDVARKLGVRILDLVVDAEAPAGSFRLQPRDDAPSRAAAEGGHSRPDDVSMVLHTSGTTSRPKIVPLSQRNLAASAQNIRATLKFTAADCGLNIMPLFHIHGLIAGVLAPLSAGSQVFCTPGFNALKFFGWMDEAKPTWYTAVPTMHQAIVGRAPKNVEVIRRHPLRFLRSSSSSMPPQVIKELEETFGAPLIEAYGMTEATHQMASNPLPPAARKPGTVGRAAGPEVAIMLDGKLLASGETGEIVIRGPNVTRGYENNPEANDTGSISGTLTRRIAAGSTIDERPNGAITDGKRAYETTVPTAARNATEAAKRWASVVTRCHMDAVKPPSAIPARTTPSMTGNAVEWPLTKSSRKRNQMTSSARRAKPARKAATSHLRVGVTGRLDSRTRVP